MSIKTRMRLPLDINTESGCAATGHIQAAMGQTGWLSCNSQPFKMLSKCLNIERWSAWSLHQEDSGNVFFLDSTFGNITYKDLKQPLTNKETLIAKIVKKPLKNTKYVP